MRIRFIATTPETLELKYHGNSSYPYQLLWNYIGPTRTHGDCYYQPKFKWFEVFNDISDGDSAYAPLGVFCLVENMHISFSLHLSVLEVLEKRQGWGTLIMIDLLEYAKAFQYRYFTVYPLNESAQQFYLRNGLTEHTINGLQLLGTTL
jgi:GNAT superfamily N-acetyltransferase